MQQIIVYRNPVEAAFWNAVMNGQFFPVIMGIVAFFVVFLTVNHMLTRNKRIRQGYGYGRSGGPRFGHVARTRTALALGAVAGFGVMFYMFILIR